MPLDMPPNYNAYTQIKQKEKIVNCITSTRVDDFLQKLDPSTLDITSYINFSNSTQLFITKNNNENIIDNSTRLNFLDENFDIYSKLMYSKKFKVKVKIKKISKFTPKIIID